MPARRAPRRRGRRRDARQRARTRDRWALLPTFLRPTSKAWTHWNRAAVEVLQGVRAALDEVIDDVERFGRRRDASRLRRIEVE